MREVEKHSEKGVFPIIERYKKSMNMNIELLRKVDIV